MYDFTNNSLFYERIKMPLLKFYTSHNLTVEEATERVKQRIVREVEKQVNYVQDLKEIPGSTPNQAEYSCKVYGFSLNGRFDSKPGVLETELNLPFAAMVVKGMIEEQIQLALNDVLK